MKNLEICYVKNHSVSFHDLMLRASEAVVTSMIGWLGSRNITMPSIVHILCGPGNNGGDGYAIASKLFKLGWKVNVLSYGKRTPSSEAAHRMYDQWNMIGGVTPIQDALDLNICPDEIVIDAVFGIGLTRPLDPLLLDIFKRIPHNVPIIAVDILTGVHADSGVYLAPLSYKPRPANLTVTFETVKPGHVLHMGAYLSGNLKVVSLGLEQIYANIATRPSLVSETIDGDQLPWVDYLQKHPTGHKYNYGHAIVFSGGHGRGGAARLAARAALRVGTGLVTICAPHESMLENAMHLDAIMLREVSSVQDLKELLKDKRINAICIGPGFGIGDYTKSMILEILAHCRPTVIDADGLTSFADNPEALFSNLNENVVLTPHMGEFNRLFPDISRLNHDDPTFSKVNCVRMASKRCGATVLLKGHDTVICSSDGNLHVSNPDNRISAAWLATAGSGDILAGLITGFLARGATGTIAANMATQLALDAANYLGAGLIADDLPDALVYAIRERCPAKE